MLASPFKTMHRTGIWNSLRTIAIRNCRTIPPPPNTSVNVHGADLRTWAELQSVLSQTGLPTSEREEFFQSEGTGLRDVVYGVGARKAY